MSKKYFLFTGLTLLLITGFYHFVYGLYSIFHGFSFEIILILIVGMVVFGLSIASLVLAIKAFKNKSDHLVASVLCVVAAAVSFIYIVYSSGVTINMMVHFDAVMPHVVYMIFNLGVQMLAAMIPLICAILSFINFKKSEADYVPSQKVSYIFYYIAAALVFSAFLAFFRAGVSASMLAVSGQNVGNMMIYLFYDLSALAILGFLTPSFVFSFFKRKQQLSRTFLMVSGIVSVATYLLAMIVTIFGDREYSMGEIDTLLIIEMFSTLIKCIVIVVSIILTKTMYKTIENSKPKTELE